MAVGGIEKSLISLHAIAAAFLATPELMLEKSEAEMLAHGIAEVNRHYKMPGMRPEHVAIASLVGCVIAIYGGKFKAIKQRKAKPADVPNDQGVNTAPFVPANTSESWFPDLARPN